MDELELFTKVFPLLLAKLEIIRQVLKAHGLKMDAGEHEFLYSGGVSLRWAEYRGPFELKTHINMEQVYFTLDACVTTPHGVTRPSIWLSAELGQTFQLYTDEVWHPPSVWDKPMEYETYVRQTLEPIQGLAKALPWGDVGDPEDCVYSDAVARETMGMMAAFFARLPEDPTP